MFRHLLRSLRSQRFGRGHEQRKLRLEEQRQLERVHAEASAERAERERVCKYFHSAGLDGYPDVHNYR